MIFQPFVKKRAIFVGCVMFPVLIVGQYLGYDSIVFTGAVAGISSGISVILFPDPKFQAGRAERSKKLNDDSGT